MSKEDSCGYKWTSKHVTARGTIWVDRTCGLKKNHDHAHMDFLGHSPRGDKS